MTRTKSTEPEHIGTTIRAILDTAMRLRRERAGLLGGRPERRRGQRETVSATGRVERETRGRDAEQHPDLERVT